MLVAAVQYKDVLQSVGRSIWFNDKYKYWNADTYWSTIDIDDDTWNKHQFVSVCNGEIIGYIGYHIYRTANRVAGLNIINFTDNIMVFGRDLHKALVDIFELYEFNKLNFTVIVGNPIEKSYDKFIKKFGGRIIGIQKQHVRLVDNKLYDEKMYEICREDYLKSKNVQDEQTTC